MYENDRGGIEFDCAPEYRARIDCDLANCALLQLFVGDQAARRVEKQHPERFKRQCSHRHLEIAEQFGAGGIDSVVVEVGPHRLDRSRLGCAKQCADRAVFTERSSQRLRGLHKGARERAMLRQQSLRYGRAIVGLDDGDEICQDGSLSPRASRRR